MKKIDLSSKRAQLSLRFFTYGVMTVATIVLSTLLIFFALGFRFDKDFNFVQGGLMRFRSFPDSAEISIDGKNQSYKTPGKANLPSGQHSVEMSLAGYRSWHKTVNLSPGQLLWLNYTRLVPDSIVTTNVREFDTMSGSLASPDRHWLLLLPRADSAHVVLADMGNEKELKFTDLTLPDAVLSKKDGRIGSLELVEWDLGSRYALLKHRLGDTIEFIRIDRTKPAEAVNITRAFSLSISEAHFSGSSPNVVFAKTDTVLRKLDLNGTSASGPLVNNLRQFLVYGSDAIAFSADQERTSAERAPHQVVGVFRNNKSVISRTLDASQQVALAHAEYDDHDYLALGSSDTGKIEIIRDPSMSGTKESNSVFAQLDLGAGVKGLKFSDSGRMLVAQNHNRFATYDLEEVKSYRGTLSFGSDQEKPLHWMDDYYLWSDSGGRLRWIEFDGQNERDITSVAPGLSATLSSNGKRLFSIGKRAVAPGFSLQSSQMTTEE